jgi:hypothetical protein
MKKLLLGVFCLSLIFAGDVTTKELYKDEGIKLIIERTQPDPIIKEVEKIVKVRDYDKEKQLEDTITILDDSVDNLIKQNDKLTDGYAKIEVLAANYKEGKEFKCPQPKVVEQKKEWYEHPLFMLGCFILGGIIF